MHHTRLLAGASYLDRLLRIHEWLLYIRIYIEVHMETSEDIEFVDSRSRTLAANLKPLKNIPIPQPYVAEIRYTKNGATQLKVAHDDSADDTSNRILVTRRANRLRPFSGAQRKFERFALVRSTINFYQSFMQSSIRRSAEEASSANLDSSLGPIRFLS